MFSNMFADVAGSTYGCPCFGRRGWPQKWPFANTPDFGGVVAPFEASLGWGRPIAETAPCWRVWGGGGEARPFARSLAFAACPYASAITHISGHWLVCLRLLPRGASSGHSRRCFLCRGDRGRATVGVAYALCPHLACCCFFPHPYLAA
jgi:hypothetical protein